MPFEKGKSGNPGGRPKALKEVLDAARENTPSMIQVLVGIANDKEAPHAARVSAASAILDRAYAKPKDCPVVLELPPVETPDGVAKAVAAIVAAMGEGSITPAEAGAMSSVLEGQRRAIETVELEKRLGELEEAVRAKPR